jgi:hypothetical protein
MMERIVDPVFADIQKEHDDAARDGRTFRSRWIVVSGYFGLLKAIAWYGCDHNDVEGRILIRASATSVAMAFLVILAWLAALEFLPLHVDTPPLVVSRSKYLLARCAQLGIPIGLTFAIFYTCAGTRVSRRMMAAICVLALGCSTASFFAPTWIPLEVDGAYGLFTGIGEERYNAMTRDERRQLSMASRWQNHAVSISRRAALYTQGSISCASLVLAAFALSILRRRRLSRYAAILAACGSCAGYFLIMRLAAQNLLLYKWLQELWLYADVVAWFPTATDIWFDLIIVAWLPNAAFALLTIAMVATTGRQSSASDAVVPT